MRELMKRITRLASQQHGLASLAQIQECGGTKSLAYRHCQAGHWQPVGRAVYRVGAGPQTFEQRAMAAVLAAGPGAVISHRTAARLWGIENRGAVPLEVSVPRGRAFRQPGVITHRVRDLDLAEVTTLHSIPVTGLARSLLDVGAVVPERIRDLVMAARRSHGLGWDRLLETLVVHSCRGRPGIAPLRGVVAKHYGEVAADSHTEDLAFILLVDSGLVPQPQKQVSVVCADGVAVTADLGWPEFRALVEVYGVDHFTNEPLQQLDLHRCNQIRLAGYGLITYSGHLLRRKPDQFIADAVGLLEQGGWRSAG